MEKKVTVSLLENENTSCEVNETNGLTNLEYRRTELENSIIKNQLALDKAKAKKIETGEYSDPNWFTTIKALIRQETIELHNINRQIKAIRKQNADINRHAIAFQQTAKKLLDIEVYERITSIADSIVGLNG